MRLPLVSASLPASLLACLCSFLLFTFAFLRIEKIFENFATNQPPSFMQRTYMRLCLNTHTYTYSRIYACMRSLVVRWHVLIPFSRKALPTLLLFTFKAN